MKLEEGATRRVLGQVQQHRVSTQAAEQLLRESLDILETLANPYEVGQTLYQLALALPRSRTSQRSRGCPNAGSHDLQGARRTTRSGKSPVPRICLLNL